MAPSVEIDVMEGLISDEVKESVHLAVVEASVIFVHGRGNHVEVTANEPRAGHIGPQVLELRDKLQLLIVSLRAIDASNPPRVSTRSV